MRRGLEVLGSLGFFRIIVFFVLFFWYGNICLLIFNFMSIGWGLYFFVVTTLGLPFLGRRNRLALLLIIKWLTLQKRFISTQWFSKGGSNDLPILRLWSTCNHIHGCSQASLSVLPWQNRGGCQGTCWGPGISGGTCLPLFVRLLYLINY